MAKSTMLPFNFSLVSSAFDIHVTRVFQLHSPVMTLADQGASLLQFELTVLVFAMYDTCLFLK